MHYRREWIHLGPPVAVYAIRFLKGMVLDRVTTIMDPDIFYFGYEYQPDLLQHFAAIGRLLALAQRFETGSRSVALIIFQRENPELFLESEDALRLGISKVYKNTLGRNVARLTLMAENEAAEILNSARLARNEIAHEITVGFEHWVDEPEKLPTILDQISLLAPKLALADRWVSVAVSVLTNEPLPGAQALHEYPEHLRNWVLHGSGA